MCDVEWINVYMYFLFNFLKDVYKVYALVLVVVVVSRVSTFEKCGHLKRICSVTLFLPVINSYILFYNKSRKIQIYKKNIIYEDILFTMS